MDSTIILILLQDGILNGAVYALLGLALVLVFLVTRVIFIPQGEFVAYGALTLAFMVNGRVPGTVNLLLIVGIVVFIADVIAALRSRDWGGLPRKAIWSLALPLVLFFAAPFVVSANTPLWVNVLFSL